MTEEELLEEAKITRRLNEGVVRHIYEVDPELMMKFIKHVDYNKPRYTLLPDAPEEAANALKRYNEIIAMD